MKLSYYGYAFNEIATSNKKRMSVKSFIRAFCQFANPSYKNQFTYNDENIFLLHSVGDLYLFIQTRSKEVIKKINSQDTSIGEIYDLLNAGEMIGFASYVFLTDSYLGFASTTMAPRIPSFAIFINDILKSININNYQFTIIPFLYQATKADALLMPFIGKSILQINKSNSCFDHLANMFGGEVIEFEDVDSFEITIKPKSRKNIEKAVKKMVSTISDEGLEKMIIKAKDEQHPALIDLYLAGKGLLADNINTRDERLILQKIKEKITNNSALQQKVIEHEQDEAIPQASIDSISQFNDAATWSTAILDIQESN